MLYTPDTASKSDDSDDGVELLGNGAFQTAIISEPHLPVLSQNISIEREDLTAFSSRDGSIITKTFKEGKGNSFFKLDNGGYIRNATEIANDVLQAESRKSLDRKSSESPENAAALPQVLIIHTHTSESYATADYYDFDYSFRTQDSSKNIVAVGAVIAQEIAKAGFAVIHDGTVHDFPLFTGAYKRSGDTVKAILAQYPSIKIVLDIHRDAIEHDESPVAAVASAEGGSDTLPAQLMIVAPADDGEWGVPDFMQNFRLAAHLQSQLENDHSEYEHLTRPVLFQYCNYNMNLSSGALLIEVGSHGNTLKQALYAGELFGKSVGNLLKDN